MSELRDLYQEVILEHNRRPRNRYEMNGATSRAQGHNPLCGDKVTIYLKVDDGVIRDVSFAGSGCAISTASASLLTESIKGKPIDTVATTFARFQEMVTAEPDRASVGENAVSIDDPVLGKLAVFAGVAEYPMRIKCATLAWHTLNAALDQREDQTVTTE